MQLFDSNAYYLHQRRALKDFTTHSFLFEHVGNELISRLEDMKRSFQKVLNLSPHALAYTSQYHPYLEESLPFPEKSFDLILSCLQGHWVNNLPGLLKSIYHCLQKEGLFIGALWGGQTLCELRESFLHAELTLTGGASPRVAPLLHPSDAPRLLAAGGFFMPVVDKETIQVTYPSLSALMKDLRGMGETNILNDRKKTFTSRKLFETAERIYAKSFGNEENKFIATFEVIYLTGWKKTQA